MRRAFRPLSFPVIALSLASAALTGCGRPSISTAEAASPALSVRTFTAHLESRPSFLSTAGTVRPAARALIAAQLTGAIESLPVTLGQTVKRGDLLARLAAPELTARLAHARAQLNQALRDERRTRDLAATGADTADAALTAADRLAAARASLAEAEALLAYTEIHAPFDGRVAQKFAFAGDLAIPGSPLLVLENPASLQVEAPVPASLAPTLSLGTLLRVHVAEIAAPFTCPVAEIAAAADPATRTVLVKLTLPPADAALSGRYARVDLPTAPTEQILVPLSAVTRFGQLERVFVIVNGHAQLRLVKTGAVHDDRVEILAGLAADERLIVAPTPALRDGQPVTAAP